MGVEEEEAAAEVVAAGAAEVVEAFLLQQAARVLPVPAPLGPVAAVRKRRQHDLRAHQADNLQIGRLIKVRARAPEAELRKLAAEAVRRRVT